MPPIYNFGKSGAAKLVRDHRRLEYTPPSPLPHRPQEPIVDDLPRVFAVRFQNVSSITMPAYGVGFAGLIDVQGSSRFGGLTVRVTNNAAGNNTGLLVNGPAAVPATGYGYGYYGVGPVLAACDDGETFTVGSIWGPDPAAADFLLYKGFDGFSLLSTASIAHETDDATFKLLPVMPSRGIVRRFQLTENWGYYTNPKTGPFTLTGKLTDADGGTLMNPEMEIPCYFSDDGDSFGATGNGRCPNALSGDQVLVVCGADFRWRVVSSWIWDDPIGTIKFFNTNYSGTPRGWGVANGTANSTANGGSNQTLTEAWLYLTDGSVGGRSTNRISSTFTAADHTNGGNNPFGNTLTHTLSGNKTADPGGTTGNWTTTLSWMTGVNLQPFERLNNGVLKT